MSIRPYFLKPVDSVVNAANFDLNVTGAFVYWNVQSVVVLVVQAVAVTTWATAILTLERSCDGVNWFALETAQTLGTGSDLSNTIDCAAIAFVRAKVTTPEGSQKFAVITAFGKASA